MTHIAVTFEKDRYRIDLAIPAELPTQLIAETIAQALELQAPFDKRFTLATQMENGIQPIPATLTPAEAGLLHGTVITLTTVHLGSTEQKPAYLEIEGGRRIPLGKQAIIGRNDPKSNLNVEIDVSSFLPNPKLISRQHAKITERNGEYFIEDLGSNNGTRLNGRRLPPGERTLLKDGDVIVLGRETARLRFFYKHPTPK
ncbi:MAG: FHA domain-containing protein [Anaerolineales bacterium]|nr:FHA domain-containing protein [Anaerolineales bacterium]MDW8279433.1 FHA domain-containing protein [Anaerolineales bacterium]